MLGHSTVPQPHELIKSKETDEMVLFEPFVLINPLTKVTFPDFDKEYYTMLEHSLYHLIFKFRKGWITSERQVIYSSDECISTVHFIFDENKEVIGINVFQRSSNVLNLEEDVQFFNYFIRKHLSAVQVDLRIMVSMPHVFKNKLRKIED
ncbi:hypothetical protein NST55_28480 [Bacillus sp. FSL R10-2789]|uniref:hypothetical protein n=1 Tax=Bacillus sp. FSL R10-2789 TaxID=2954662 RepID=UPI0030FB7C33